MRQRIIKAKKWAFYNDADEYVCAWTRNLIRAGVIMDGDVDCRSITDIQPEELSPYVQCHFFNGVAGWGVALRLACWDQSREVWTGSCPCQPFSAAGKRDGQSDARDLWPEFFRLISARRPAIVFGEQVASADVLGKFNGRPKRGAGKTVINSPSVWIDRVRVDVETASYAFGVSDVPAAGVGAPHIRQRCWWTAERMAEPNGGIVGDRHVQRSGEYGQFEEDGQSGSVGRLDDSTNPRRPREWQRGSLTPPRDQARMQEFAGRGASDIPSPDRLADLPHHRRGQERPDLLRLPERDNPQGGTAGLALRGAPYPDNTFSRLGHTQRDGAEWTGREERVFDATSQINPWSDSILLLCLDGKYRRIPNPDTQPGIRVLASGVPSRMSKLRALGNGLCIPVAVEFIRSYMDCRP